MQYSIIGKVVALHHICFIEDIKYCLFSYEAYCDGNGEDCVFLEAVMKKRVSYNEICV